MRTALLQLLEDFLSALVFLSVFALTGRLALATAVAIAVALGQLAYNVARKRSLSAMQWIGLSLTIVLAGLTLLTHDSRFVRLKPSIAHFAIGAAMLKRGWQLPYLPPRVKTALPERTLLRWGYAWAGLMMLMGAANLAAANWLSVATWGVFLFALLVGKLLFFGVQYLSMRAAVRGQLRERAESQPAT